MFLISRATQKQAIIYGKHVYHFLFLQWLFLKGVVLPGRWACFFDVKSIKSERLQSHLFDRLPKKSDWTILWESRNTSVICSDLSIAKIAWNHRRGACFFMVSLKSLRINHHYSMSFAEERLYSPLYLRVCFSMSRRHKTRFFLIMLEWKTALRPPVKRKNCSWAASTWCSAFNPWEVIASDSSFFPCSSSFRPSRKSPLISTLHYLVQNRRFNYFVPTSGQRISPHNTNLFPLGNNNFPSKRINRQFLLHIPQRLPPNSTRWPSQATETSWLLVPALLNMQSWTIR